MKWVGWLGVGGILGVAGLIGGRSFWAARVLEYYIGSEVGVGAVAVEWLGGKEWQAHLQGVEVHSTETTLPFAPIKAEKVRLHFKGLRLRRIEFEGVSAVLLRQGRGSGAVRNYQRLFPKRGRGRPLSIAISGRKVHFYLFNQPAQLEIEAVADRVEGLLEVDSLWVRIAPAKVCLERLEICYRGRLYEGLRGGILHYRGQYRKPTDTWEVARLQLDFPALKLGYEGKVVRWAALWGGMHAWVDSVLLQQWAEIPPLFQAVMGPAVRVSAGFSGDTVGFHAWGEGPRGHYEACATWGGDHLRALEGLLWKKPWYVLAFRSSDGTFWRVRGRGSYGGYPWGMEAELGYASEAGRAYFRFGDIEGRYEGSLRRGRGVLRRERVIAMGVWDAETGLTLRIDTLSWSEVAAFLGAYRPLMRGQGQFPFSWQVEVRRLSIGQDWKVENLQLSSREKGIHGRGMLYYQPWGISLRAEGLIANGGVQGRAWGKSPEDDLWVELGWQGDSVRVSLAGFFGGAYYVGLAGWGSLSQRRLWVETGRLQSAAGSYIEVQGLFTDSLADGGASGEVFLPEILSWLPLKGVEVEDGHLKAQVCFQEPWQTLLSWDNQAEGWTRLSAVNGRFVKPDLPLSLTHVQVVFNPVATRIEGLYAQVGELRLMGEAEVQGTLGYLYEDWRGLRGRATLYVDNFRLLDVWRVRRGGTYLPRLLLPEKMHLQAQVVAQNVDIVGFRFERVEVEGELAEQVIRLDRVEAGYKGGKIGGWGVLDAVDTSCYIAAWQAKAEALPVDAVLRESGLIRVPAIRALGLRGEYAGEFQAAIRFAPNLTWKQNSTFLATGRISQGLFQTPAFFRWLRPFYLAAYRDSMDFLAQISGLSIVDGYLQLHKSLVLTRIAAFHIEGTHLLARDRFLYRLQGARLYRKAQRYPYLERLSPYLVDQLASSLWLFYVEKEGGRVRWHYPFKVLLRRLITG